MALDEGRIPGVARGLPDSGTPLEAWTRRGQGPLDWFDSALSCPHSTNQVLV